MKISGSGEVFPNPGLLQLGNLANEQVRMLHSNELVATLWILNEYAISFV
jgi:hypothetical protein